MENLGEFIQGLFPDNGSDDALGFVPVVFYHPEMDYLMYINEDCSYVADRISRFLTVLWHPSEPGKLIGLKLKGFRLMYERVRESAALTDAEFPLFISWLSLALYRSAEELIDEHERRRLKEVSAIARKIVGNAEIPSKVWKEAA
jgi:hypothetical protein